MNGGPTPTPAGRCLEGGFPAVLTPLDPNLAPDGERLVRHCQALLAQGCNGLAVLGTTGEANSFSLEERLGLLDHLHAAKLPPRKLLLGTGCCALTDTVRLTRRALDLGAAAVLMLPPFYYKAVSDDGLFASYAEVIERVGDGRLRICLYHFPQMSGVPLSAGLIERLCGRYGETITGLKDSSGDLAGMVAMARRFPGLSVFSGSDELLLPLLEAGGAGCITACCNVIAPMALAVIDAWRQGNHAAAVAAQAKLTEMRKLIATYPMAPALKEIVAQALSDPQWRALRPPLLPLGEPAAKALSEALARVSFEFTAYS